MQPEATTLERNGATQGPIPTNGAGRRSLAYSPAMRWLSLALRIFLGIVFVVAGAEKLIALKTFGAAISHYEILPESISNILALLFVWTEITVGLLLFAGAAVRGSALVISSMLTIFLIAILSAMARGMDIDCGCFAGDPVPVGWPKVFEDLGMLVAAIFLIYFPHSYLTIDHLLRSEGDGNAKF
jgi:uncharacterized membrane protein YphA (DoxX/SURF4 family)